MTIYEFKCRCGGFTRDLPMADRDRPLSYPCPHCGELPRRNFSFRMGQVMHEHFNQSTGTVVSSMRQFNDTLKRQSDEQTAKTGIEHRFVPCDMKDLHSGSDKGMKETHDFKVRAGLKEPTPKLM